jgi:hypothetical protein
MCCEFGGASFDDGDVHANLVDGFHLQIHVMVRLRIEGHFAITRTGFVAINLSRRIQRLQKGANLIGTQAG